MALITLRGITTAFGGPPVLDGVNLTIASGDRLCLVGRNGSGKSTLLRLIAEEIVPDSGDLARRNGLKTAILHQDASTRTEGTVFDVVAAGMGEAAETLAEYHRISHLLAEQADETPTPGGAVGNPTVPGGHRDGLPTPGGAVGNPTVPGGHTAGLVRRHQELQKSLDDSDGFSLHREVDRVISRLSLDADKEFVSLSGGSKRRVLLARALVSDPEILLLDEPTNQLDIDTIVWLEDFLLRRAKTLVFVTHDRAFARRLANRVAELDRGRLIAFPCGFDAFMKRREALLEAEATRAAAFDRKLAEEEAWVRQGIKARRTRNEGRVRALVSMRDDRATRRERPGQVRLEISESDASGRLFCKADGVEFGYGDEPVIRDLTTTILRGDRVGIIGPNGSGKTTLLRILSNELKPQSGSIRFGKGSEVVYLDQFREQLDQESSARESVGEGRETVTVNGRPRHILAYLRDFLFTPERALTPVRVLSGGERNRLLLAKLFTRPCNVMVLDEPTNDLDGETLDLLEDLILEFKGTLLLVSHDRDFLNNVVTSTISVCAGGNVSEHVGGYDDWLRQAGGSAAAGAGIAKASLSASAADAADQRGRRSRDTSATAGGKSTGGPGGVSSEAGESPTRRKLSYKEERELASLPQRIEALEEEQSRIHSSLADPELYRNSGGTVAEVTTRLEQLECELEAAFARWEELESMRG